MLSTRYFWQILMKLEFSRQIFENFSSSIGTATLVGYGLLNYR